MSLQGQLTLGSIFMILLQILIVRFHPPVSILHQRTVTNHATMFLLSTPRSNHLT